MKHTENRDIGVVFDFNGTLFWDTEYQERSWDTYLAKYGVELTKEEKLTHIHGRNGKDSFEYIFKKELGREEVARLIEEKEEYYREECERQEVALAPGAAPLIEHLLERGVSIAIATAAGKTNVEYFIRTFNLLAYFTRERIVYNDGTIAGKPAPDLFLEAMRRLGTENGNTTVFEDSYAGIQAAENAHSGNIIIVNSNNESYPFAYKTIRHFDEVDRETDLTPPFRRATPGAIRGR